MLTLYVKIILHIGYYWLAKIFLTKSSLVVKFTFELSFLSLKQSLLKSRTTWMTTYHRQLSKTYLTLLQKKITRMVLSRLFYFSSKAWFILPANVNAIRMLISKVYVRKLRYVRILRCANIAAKTGVVM